MRLRLIFEGCLNDIEFLTFYDYWKISQRRQSDMTTLSSLKKCDTKQKGSK